MVMQATSAIETVNAQFRKAIKKRGSFPNSESVRKVLYLAIMKSSERWTRAIIDWPAAQAVARSGRCPLCQRT